MHRNVRTINIQNGAHAELMNRAPGLQTFFQEARMQSEGRLRDALEVAKGERNIRANC